MEVAATLEHNVSTKKRATRMKQRFETRWAALPGIVGPEGVGWRYKIVLVIIINMHIV